MERILLQRLRERSIRLGGNEAPMPTMICLALIVSIAGQSIGSPARVDNQVCGRNSLVFATAFVASGKVDTTHLVEKAEQLLPDDKAPFSIADLVEAGQRLGIRLVGAKWREPTQATFYTPAVIRISVVSTEGLVPHFVFVVQSNASSVMVCDTLNDEMIEIDRDVLLSQWSGEAVYVANVNDIGLAWIVLKSKCPPIGILLALLFVPITALAINAWFARKRPPKCGSVARCRSFGVFRGIAVCILAGFAGFVVDQWNNAGWAHVANGLAQAVVGSEAPLELSFAPEVIKTVVLGPLPGATVTLEASVINRSQRAIQIDHVVSSCACAAVDNLAGIRIGSGQSKKFAVRLRPTNTGVAKAAIQVWYAKESRVAILPIEVFVRSELAEIAEVRPEKIEYTGRLMPGMNQRLTISVLESASASTVGSEFEVDIKGIDCKKLSRTVVGKQDGVLRVEYVLEVTLRAIPRQREFGGSVRLRQHTGSSSMHVCRIHGVGDD